MEIKVGRSIQGHLECHSECHLTVMQRVSLDFCGAWNSVDFSEWFDSWQLSQLLILAWLH
jgi:hypothetical protein